MNIKEARLAAGLTQQKMSEILEIPKRTIENWEAGSHKCPAYVERLVIKELKKYEKENEEMFYTKKEVLEMNEGKYAEIEYYKYSDSTKRLHSDFIDFDVPEPSDEEKVEDFFLMDEEEYEKTINANSCVDTDFGEWYGNKEAKILVIICK